MTRWQFFDLIERGRRQLGLSKGAIVYLEVVISNTMDDDFIAGRICRFLDMGHENRVTGGSGQTTNRAHRR